MASLEINVKYLQFWKFLQLAPRMPHFAMTSWPRWRGALWRSSPRDGEVRCGAVRQGWRGALEVWFGWRAPLEVWFGAADS